MFKGNLVYIMNSRPAKVPRKTPSQKQNFKARCRIRKTWISVTDKGKKWEMTGQVLQVLFTTGLFHFFILIVQ